jgi:hypothetical protein
MFLPWRHHCCLKADSLLSRHLAAEPSNRLLVSLSHWLHLSATKWFFPLQGGQMSENKWGLPLNGSTTAIGGAHQQTSERVAPPVSVEEKGKATGDKRKMLLFLLMSIQY